jgi:hypothetical protein
MMAVYVDDMRMSARVGRINGVWCHLTADTEEELHEFATKLGLRRSWFQPQKYLPDNEFNRRRGQAGKPKGRFHYDIVENVRRRAVLLGAKELEYGSDAWMDVFNPTWRQEE